ncbi:hypothetical protein BGZ99_006008 [Dissophora globulifera]|uniref:Uncharacterized protein n=1 Tax=Dissophora globulifera TaxID=979702 RepID=A0A9P6RVD3_9FUNG|nr:hypothetical protein BGZ99_005987 [Dissophora globulifera]KAG0330315.1 hypothetical protein BGZ99_006008 [Dissophora globulifera]
MSFDSTIDALEVLLNPGLIKTKIEALSQEQAYVQGRRLLQDLLSVGRFGTPVIVPADGSFPTSNGNYTNGGKQDDRSPGHEESGMQQTMQLSERQGKDLSYSLSVVSHVEWKH